MDEEGRGEKLVWDELEGDEMILDFSTRDSFSFISLVEEKKRFFGKTNGCQITAVPRRLKFLRVNHW